MLHYIPSRALLFPLNYSPLVSRSWYTRDTVSLACWLRPWQGKCCLIVVIFDQPAHAPPVPTCPYIPRELSSSRSCGPAVGGRGTHKVRTPELEVTKVNSVWLLCLLSNLAHVSPLSLSRVGCGRGRGRGCDRGPCYGRCCVHDLGCITRVVRTIANAPSP